MRHRPFNCTDLRRPITAFRPRTLQSGSRWLLPIADLWPASVPAFNRALAMGSEALAKAARAAEASSQLRRKRSGNSHHREPMSRSPASPAHRQACKRLPTLGRVGLRPALRCGTGATFVVRKNRSGRASRPAPTVNRITCSASAFRSRLAPAEQVERQPHRAHQGIGPGFRYYRECSPRN